LIEDAHWTERREHTLLGEALKQKRATPAGVSFLYALSEEKKKKMEFGRGNSGQ